MYKIKQKFLLVISLLLLLATQANAETITIAVASNFTSTLRSLSEKFTPTCDCEIKIVSASTGKLFTQITEGAAFDAFFSADMSAPSRLVEKDLAKQESYFVYAVGVLTVVGDLNLNNTSSVAIANPEFAPYGKAAMEYINSLDYRENIKKKLVLAENASLAYQFATDRKAKSAIVPLSDSGKQENKLPVRIVPKASYGPLRQAAVIVTNSKVIEDFFSFVKSDEGRAIIVAAGYKVDTPDEKG